MLPIHFAPLQGYTEDAYRRLHQQIFGGVDVYYTPFVRIEHGEVRSKDMRDVRPEFNKGVNVVPQVIASGGEELKKLLSVLRPLDYKRIDINMGCPFPLQTRHGRGAGILVHPEKVKEISDTIKQNDDIQFSVKMRLGLDNETEWQSVLPILNDTPLTHITVHPRIATQQYNGEIDIDAFEQILAVSHNPVIYNGEIMSVDEIKQIESRYKEKIAGIMIGRGLLARPSLAYEYRNGTILTDHQLLQKLRNLHSRLLEHYQSIIPSESQQLNKIRTFWDFSEETIGRKQWKKLKKAGNMKNYLANLP